MDNLGYALKIRIEKLPMQYLLDTTSEDFKTLLLLIKEELEITDKQHKIMTKIREQYNEQITDLVLSVIE